jgi:ABC-type branched-subunit amino acid transport system ATPase component
MLRVDGVTHRFHGVPALNDVSLSVPDGRITGLIGPNGSGKSTLFNIISGILTPEMGTISIDGRPLPKGRPMAAARAGLARTFQIPRVAQRMTVLENLLLARQANRTAAQSDTKSRSRHTRRGQSSLNACWEMARELDLGHVANTPAGSLSGGQLKLLSLGMALLREPGILLLDEPVAGVNSVVIERIAEMLRKRRDSGLAILLIEHNLGLVTELCDDVWVLDVGELIAHGKPGAVSRDPKVVAAYLGNRGVHA